MVDLTPEPRPDSNSKEEPSDSSLPSAPETANTAALDEFFNQKPDVPAETPEQADLPRPNGSIGKKEPIEITEPLIIQKSNGNFEKQEPIQILPDLKNNNQQPPILDPPPMHDRPIINHQTPAVNPPPVAPGHESSKVNLRNHEKPKPDAAANTPRWEIMGPQQISDLLTHLLREMVHRRASDLHLRSGTVIFYRVDGNLIPYGSSVMPPENVKEILYHMLPVRHRKIFEAKNEADFSFAVPGVGRFRGNAFRQRGSVAVVLRQIPTTMPTVAELNLPLVLEKFCRLSRGLVLICGPTGSGKSTSLASMINKINEDRAEHIVTVEDPIEFLHRDKKSIISQRELGTDTISFGEALKHVLRQDPDVILLGEMRDLETTSTAITAAQTGHLVLSTLHTTDAVQTINRILDLYPPHQQNQIRYQLADVLKGVVCMRLISHAKGVGRVPACEVLVVTALVKKAIFDNKMADVQEAIRQGQYYGMQTFHQSLLKLYKEGVIKLDDALEAASNPEELMMAIRGITQGTEGAA